jgi:hypothetical protein
MSAIEASSTVDKGEQWAAVTAAIGHVTALHSSRIGPWMRVKEFMKAYLGYVFRTYIAIGVILGLIMWGSYAWSVGLSVSGQLAIQPVALFASSLRVIAWGPELAIWATSPNTYTFGNWLAPGLYAAPSDKRKPGASDIEQHRRAD